MNFSPAKWCAATVVTMVVLSTSCATTSGRGPFDRESTGDVVTRAELTRAAPGGSVMAALQKTRPGFLVGRGSVPTVSIDGSPPTKLSLLGLISTADVVEVRLLRASSNAGRAVVLPNGDVVLGNVILVVTRRQ